MAVDPSTLGNLSRFRTLSVITLSGTVSAGKGLVEAMPKTVLPDNVNEAMGYMKEAIGEAEEGMADRLDKADTALERAFDVLVDRIWILLRARLEFWHCYSLQGVDLLSEEEQAEAEFDKNRKLAAVAKELLVRLFANGTDFLRLPYPQQAAHMAARLRYIEKHDLQDQFKEIVGASPAVLVRVCQRRYEAMVASRTARDNAVAVNLKPLRAKLAWAAENYAAALLGTLPKGDAEWVDVVFAALQPMLATDVLRNGSPGDPPEPKLPDTEDDLEQLLGFELAKVEEPAVVEGEPAQD